MLVERLWNIARGFKDSRNNWRNRWFKNIYKNQLDKTCFAHEAAYTNSKNLAKRTVSDKTLKDRVYETALTSKYKKYQR